MIDLIDGVKIKKLVTHTDERGWLFEILRNDDEIFQKFGQTYITSVLPGVVKAWHCHSIQYDNFCAVSGKVKLVLADLRKDSPTCGKVNEFIFGDDNRMLITIPPHLHHGIKGLSSQPALILNCPTEPYNHQNPDEIRLPYDTDLIDYDWDAEA